LTVTDDSGASSDPGNVTVTVGDSVSARILLVNTAEGGANGVTFATPGGQATGSGTNFDTVSVGTGGELSYSTDQVAAGTTSYKMIQGTGSIITGWTTALSASVPIDDFVFQGHIFLTALPSTNTILYKGYADTLYTPSLASWSVLLNPSGQLLVQNSASATMYTLSTPLATNTWYRIEGEFVAGSSSQLKVSVGSSTDVFAFGSGRFTNQTASARQGIGTASSGIGTMYFDDFTVAIGPGFLTESVFSNQPPFASAGSDQTSIEPWSTVTMIGTDSDSDGAVASRTWRQVSGTAVTLTGSGNTASYTAPAAIISADLVFGYQVLDDLGATSAENTVTHTILPATERAVIGGVEVPIQFNHITNS
jgi:hypothetical protein